MLRIFAIIGFVVIPVRSDFSGDYFSDSTSNTRNHLEQIFVDANNAFALRLYKQLSSANGNLFFCPICVSSSLAMLMDASAGDTSSELNKLLQFRRTKLNSTQIGDFYAEFTSRMRMAACLTPFSNTLFAQKNFDIKPEFAERAEDVYNTEILESDFYGNPQQAVWDVNETVKIKTQGRIKRLFERLDGRNSMFLVNAVYFKTNFGNIFDSDLSLKDKFYNHGFRDRDIEVFFMEKLSAVQRIANSYDFRALELPCEGENSSAIKIWILLPHKTGALTDVEYGLSTATFMQIQESFRDVVINITIPRIRLDFSKDISKDLQKLGLQKAFDAEANFSSMSEIKGLHLSEVLQRAIVDINRNEAPHYEASYSDLKNDTEIVEASEYVPPFKANHPFVFCVIDSSTGLILHLGRVYEF